jgi:hypothetical protein
MGHVTGIVDRVTDMAGFDDWRVHIDPDNSPRLTHAVLAIAANEVLELVRLPFALITIPLLFRKRIKKMPTL